MCYSPDIYNSGSHGGGVTVEKGGAGCNNIIVCGDTDLALTKQSLKKNFSILNLAKMLHASVLRASYRQSVAVLICTPPTPTPSTHLHFLLLHSGSLFPLFLQWQTKL